MPDPFDTPGSHPLFVVGRWTVFVEVNDRGSSVHLLRTIARSLRRLSGEDGDEPWKHSLEATPT